MSVSRAGFTLVELMVAITIFGLVSVNMMMVSKTGAGAIKSEAFRSTLEDEANLTSNRIRRALLSASADSLDPVIPAPLGSDHLQYQMTLGANEEGQTLYGDPERIHWAADPDGRGRVLWTTSPALDDERTLVWSSAIPNLAQGELANGIDDNENLLTDETGLAFAVHDQEGLEREVEVYLTVLRIDPNGKPAPSQRRILVTCRN